MTTANRDMMAATTQAIAEDIAYQAALDTSNAALKVYQVAVKAYRARTIGDAEFMAAQDVYRAWLEYQDWGTGWIQYFEVEQDTLLSFSSCFYFGE